MSIQIGDYISAEYLSKLGEECFTPGKRYRVIRVESPYTLYELYEQGNMQGKKVERFWIRDNSGEATICVFCPDLPGLDTHLLDGCNWKVESFSRNLKKVLG